MPTTKRKTTNTKAAKSKTAKASAAKVKKVAAKSAVKASKTSTTKTKVSPAEPKKTRGRKTKATSDKATEDKVSSSKIAAKKVSKHVEPHALDDEVTEKVRQLIHLSREQGFLTYRDVDKALPKIADQPEELQNVISIFNNLEIKLMDSKDVEKFKKKKEETEEESAKSNQSDMLDDPVRMYLKQMGKVLSFPEKKKLIFPKGLKVLKLQP